MSWDIIGSNGKGDMIATNSGIIALRKAPDCPASLKRFLETGVANAKQLEAIRRECAAVPHYEYLVERFAGLTAPVILSH
jgi:hypothetical protein